MVEYSQYKTDPSSVLLIDRSKDIITIFMIVAVSLLWCVPPISRDINATDKK